MPRLLDNPIHRRSRSLEITYNAIDNADDDDDYYYVCKGGELESSEDGGGY